MKKFICGILATAMMFALAANVCAEQVSFTFNAPCQGIADTQLYNYHGTGTAKKNGYSNIVYMRHSVTQIDAGETNRIAAYDFTTKKTMGAHWHPSDRGQYPCTSNAIQHGHEYNAAGRGNTNYASKYGLNTITLTGTCYSDVD